MGGTNEKAGRRGEKERTVCSFFFVYFLYRGMWRVYMIMLV